MRDTIERVSRRRVLAAAAALGAWTTTDARDAAGATQQPAAGGPAAGAITDVPGIRVGHFTDARRPTGCTVLLFDAPVTAGVDYDGSAPGESLGVMLQPVSPLDRIHGLLLTGGGPMALGATAGVVRYLEERKVGYDWGVPNIRIPIVVGAVIDDLAIGDGRIRVGPDEAYQACASAAGGAVAEGSVGVGSGATVGKMLVGRGMKGMKGGLGTASARLGDVVIAALAVANSAGDIVDRRDNHVIAGARTADDRGFARTVDVLRRDLESRRAGNVPLADAPFRATTLTIVATNAAFDKTRLTKLAMMANTGPARVINPYHTDGDGDQVIALSTGALDRRIPLTVIGAIAAEVAADAVVRAVTTATGVPGWRAVRDL